MAVIVPFESPSSASIDQLVELVAADMERVNATILSRTGSEVTMIPEVANHLISSGGKRLRPMLTLAMAGLTGYSGDGHIKLAASVEFMMASTSFGSSCVTVLRILMASSLRSAASRSVASCTCALR